ncbi:MAG: TonB C-terminal domain-containing protein [Terracidiphilus sp.]
MISLLNNPGTGEVHSEHALVLEAKREPVAASAAGSLVLHGTLFGLLMFYGVLAGLFHHNLWGNPGEGGAIQVSLVSNAIPLPHEEQNQNVLMTETPSKAPAPPEPKAKAAVDEKAIPISGKETKPKQEPARKTQQHQPPPKQNNLAQFGEQSGSAMPRATMAQNTASNGPVSITNGDFGSRFGWYVDIIKRKVSQNWNRYEVDQSTPKSTTTEIYFRVNRQGLPSNFKINKPSGSNSLDQSCLRATQRVDTFGNLPSDSNLQYLDVTYDCVY